MCFLLSLGDAVVHDGRFNVASLPCSVLALYPDGSLPDWFHVAQELLLSNQIANLKDLLIPFNSLKD